MATVTDKAPAKKATAFKILSGELKKDILVNEGLMVAKQTIDRLKVSYKRGVEHGHITKEAADEYISKKVKPLIAGYNDGKLKPVEFMEKVRRLKNFKSND